MSKRSDQDHLRDIQTAIARVIAYTAALTYEQFLHDHKTQDAVVRNLEVIGEATKNLSDDLRQAYADVPWRSLAGVRDKMIHHYFGVNYETVWAIAAKELPELLTRIEVILEKGAG